MRFLAQIKRTAKPGKPNRLSIETFERLRAFLYEKTGIYFQDNKKYLLESRTSRRMGALEIPTFEAYLEHIEQFGGRQELPALINEITINETSFFRTPAQCEILEHEIIPELIQRSPSTNRVRIWSAACSTGDEPYTLALLVEDRLQARYPGVRFEIIGTDINTEVLQQAKNGIYKARAIRNVPPEFLRKYFTQEGDLYQLNTSVRRRVQFQQMNLMDRTSMRSMADVDIILCANVLIYFDTPSKQAAVEGLHDSLSSGGYLLVGFSETLYGITDHFQAVRFSKALAYRKGGQP